MKPVVLSHPSGNTFVRALLNALNDAGVLERFFTALSFSAKDALLCTVPASFRNELLRRSFEIPATRITTRPAREFIRLLSSRLGLRSITRHERGFGSVDAVYQDLDRFTARQISRVMNSDRIGAVYCYEDCALETFRAAKKKGIRCYYDLPIAYWETSHLILSDEAARSPEWEPTFGITQDSEEKLARKTEELELADAVVVPSLFVMNTLPPVSKNQKRILATFGSPETPARPRPGHGRKLRVLFAGSMSQRKGLADLFSAMALLKRSDVELVVLGTPLMPMDFYRKQCPAFKHERTRQHGQVLELMSSCDVLVLPSLVEGRALVQQEAMMCGLPLIVTANAGGEDLVEAGRTGFLVPIRSPQSIAERIDWMANHRSECTEMGLLARKKAETVTWAAYVDAILSSLRIESECDHAVPAAG